MVRKDTGSETPGAGDVIGTCPRCGDPIHGDRLLFTYESSKIIALLAECPSCEEIIYPL